MYWFGWGFVLAFRIKIEELSAKAARRSIEIVLDIDADFV